MAIKLRKPRTEPEWIEIGFGAALLALQPTTTIVFAARARADELATQLAEAGEVVTKTGARIEGPIDLGSPEALAKTSQSLFVVSLAEMAVSDWRGVLDADGEPLQFDAKGLTELLSDPELSETFLRKYYRPVHEVVLEGNG